MFENNKGRQKNSMNGEKIDDVPEIGLTKFTVNLEQQLSNEHYE
jgi:hypothetical protein